MLSAGYCINDGLQKARELYKDRQNVKQIIDNHPQGSSISNVPPAVDEWARKELQRLEIAGYETVPLVKYDSGKHGFAEWALGAGRVFFIDQNKLKQLDASLKRIKDSKDYFHDKQEIAQSKVWLGHEAGHFKNKDSRKKMAAYVIIPVCVQGISS